LQIKLLQTGKVRKRKRNSSGEGIVAQVHLKQQIADAHGIWIPACEVVPGQVLNREVLRQLGEFQNRDIPGEHILTQIC
jgi:hypothetical protein